MRKSFYSKSYSKSTNVVSHSKRLKITVLSVFFAMISIATYASNKENSLGKDYLYLQAERMAVQEENDITIRTRTEKIDLFIPLRQDLKGCAKVRASQLDVNTSTKEVQKQVALNSDRTKEILFPYTNLLNYIAFANMEETEAYITIDKETMDGCTRMLIDVLALMEKNNAKSTFSLFGLRGSITGYVLNLVFEGTEEQSIDNLKGFGLLISQDVKNKKSEELVDTSQSVEDYKVTGLSYITKEEMRVLKKKK